ncbi:Lrp/AsnC family transcriptional regulator [Sorangium sp. So ce295]|uniref:Lrp/AsnC family transcriptional regulator n=1 Tax=Sorangium sp. So ce295 TaxID=3133295 RepID=UPI003F62F509
MDAIDLKAIHLLSRDARRSWADLGEAVGLSAPAVAERVRRLEERGVITGWEARLDARTVGAGLTAFISVSIANRRGRGEFLRAVERAAEIQECHHVAGDEDYLLKVRCRDTEALERLLTQELKAHDGVVRTRTTIVLSTAKETALPPLPLPSDEARDGEARPRKAPGRGAARKEAP